VFAFSEKHIICKCSDKENGNPFGLPFSLSEKRSG